MFKCKALKEMNRQINDVPSCRNIMIELLKIYLQKIQFKYGTRCILLKDTFNSSNLFPPTRNLPCKASS